MEGEPRQQEKVKLNSHEMKILEDIQKGIIDETGHVAKGEEDEGTRILEENIEVLLQKGGMQEVLDHLKEQLDSGRITKSAYVTLMIKKIKNSENLEDENIELIARDYEQEKRVARENLIQDKLDEIMIFSKSTDRPYSSTELKDLYKKYMSLRNKWLINQKEPLEEEMNEIIDSIKDKHVRSAFVGLVTDQSF